MSSSLSRSAYAEAFQHNDPAATARLLKARVQGGREVNERLADYFSERAEVSIFWLMGVELCNTEIASCCPSNLIVLLSLFTSIDPFTGINPPRNGNQSQAEEAYAASLQRALSKLKGGKIPFSLRGSGNTPHAGLGNASVTAIERVIEKETSQIASLHERFATRCRDQLEVPLRNRANKEDWQTITRQDKQSDSLLKDIEDAQGKVQKAQAKDKKGADKLPGLMQAQSGAENAWRNHLPAYLPQYQQLDHARLNTIKELLTAFETLQNDLGRERMEAAERGLEACLLWEVEQELTEFISKEGFRGSGAPSRAPAQAAMPNIAVNNDIVQTNDRPGAGRPRAGTNASSSQSIHSTNNTPQKSGGLLSAFRSGGKLDRRKSTMVPASAPSARQQSEDGRETLGERPSTGSRERQQSYRSNASSTDDFGRPQQDRENGRGNSTESNSLRPSATTKRSNRDSFMPSFSSLGLKRKGGDKTQLRDNEDIDEGDTTFTSSSNVDRNGPAGATGYSDSADRAAPDTSRSLNPFSGMGSNADRPLSQASDATNRPMNQGFGSTSPTSGGFQVSTSARFWI